MFPPRPSFPLLTTTTTTTQKQEKGQGLRRRHSLLLLAMLSPDNSFSGDSLPRLPAATPPRRTTRDPRNHDDMLMLEA
ncbi:hypothetical protein E2C01_057748 [Portunus trituberculatus]|uniref:Uncharacterized protein n=1 Tax=Portunus trituberculatus TaxID=210409 RepID=A0A5B7H3G9_PORTR|nr:hypothetical protein [Portunus trituberculatus]